MVSNNQLSAIAEMAAQAVNQTINNYPGGITTVPKKVLSSYYVVGFVNAIIRQTGEQAIGEECSKETLQILRNLANPHIVAPVAEALKRFTAYLEGTRDPGFSAGLQDGLMCSNAVTGDLSSIPLPMLAIAADTASGHSSGDEPTHSAIAAALLVHTLYRHLSEQTDLIELKARSTTQRAADLDRESRPREQQLHSNQSSKSAEVVPQRFSRPHRPQLASNLVPPIMGTRTTPHKAFFALMVAIVAWMFVSNNVPGGAYIGLTAAMLFDFPTWLLAVPVALLVRPYGKFISIALVAGLVVAIYRISDMNASTAAAVDRRTLYFMAQLMAVLILAHAVNLLHHFPQRGSSRPRRY